MIKFFRKIRRRLLTERKTRKYFLYAVGEILLVVIGILIAVSINNFKEANDKKEIETQLYHGILADLREDLAEIRDNYDYNEYYLSRYRMGSEIILKDQTKEMVDTLATIASQLTKFSDFKNVQPLYDRLFVSGEHDLISNKAILNDLKRLGALYNHINRLEKDQQEYMYMVLPKISKFVRINPPEVKEPNSLYDYQFHNDIEIFIMIGEEKSTLYSRAISELTDLISRLEELLK